MVKYILTLFILFSCASNTNKQLDQFQFVLKLMENNDHNILSLNYGKPTKTTKDKDGILEYYELNNKDQHTFQVLWDQRLKNIKSIQVFLWGNFDNYEYLKEKLGKYKWIESKKKLYPRDHYIGDIREVSIPEIKAGFEYQADAINRKILYVYFGR